MSQASGALRSLIESSAPRRPYCALEKNQAHIRPLSTALGEPYLQLNPPVMAAWLILDIDRPGAAMAWEDAKLQPPTFIASNPENGHAHLGYALAAPVCKSNSARAAPLRYLAALEAAFVEATGADMAFSGPLSKNPLHPAWRLWEPANAPVYELSELHRGVDLPKRPRRRPRPEGLSRNCDLFDSLRNWAYQAVRDFWRPGRQEAFEESVLQCALALNSFPSPLGYSEVKGIARSVARYTWRRMTPAGFRAVQAGRGRRSGEVRRQATADLRAEAKGLHAAGKSKSEIALALDVPRPTIVRWLSE